MGKRVYISEVSQAIEHYFHRMGITKVDAARMLAITPQAVSQQLRLPFGKNSSIKWSNAFGFNREYLLTGEGVLLDKNNLSQREQQAYDDASRELAEIAENKKEDEVNYQANPIPNELVNEDDNYRKIDIDRFISEAEWETDKDYNLALEIGEISRTQKSDLENEIAYLNQEFKRLTMENKKLFIENVSLRRRVMNQ